jgi:hypothetical protein
LIAGIRDRPARDEALGTGAHNGNFSKRVRYAACIDKTTTGFITCNVCLSLRIDHLKRTPLLLPVRFQSMRVSQIPYCQFCVDFEYTFGNSIKSPPESSFLSAGGEPATNLNTDIGTDFRIQGVHQPAATTTTYQFTSPILRLKSIPIHPLSKLKRHRDDWRYPLRLAFGSPLPRLRLRKPPSR